MTLKYEFETIKEFEEAMKHLDRYHNCEKCRGKIVMMSVNKKGETICGYCKQPAQYPRLTKKAFEKWLKGEEKKSALWKK